MFIGEFERAAKSGRSPFTVFYYLFQFQSCNGVNKGSITAKIAQEICRNHSKSIKFVMSCNGHVDGMKKKTFHSHFKDEE